MRSISSRGPIETLSILFGLGKVYWLSKTYKVYCVFFFLNVLFDGTVGTVGTGGTDRTEYQKCPLIFFILRYIKHYTHIYLYI